MKARVRFDSFLKAVELIHIINDTESNNMLITLESLIQQEPLTDQGKSIMRLQEDLSHSKLRWHPRQNGGYS